MKRKRVTMFWFPCFIDEDGVLISTGVMFPAQIHGVRG
jgi:hypothetical protein